MGELKWFVIRAVSGQERKVKSYLENEIIRQNLSEHIAQILIPSEKVFEMRNGKKRVREKTFFPGYVLVFADLEHGEALHTITSVPGVLGFLGSNDGSASKKPVPLRTAEVNRILGIVDETVDLVEKSDIAFHVGEFVTVMDGPFKGFEGTIQENLEDKKKLNVIVKIFGRNTPVELSYMQVEKIQ